VLYNLFWFDLYEVIPILWPKSWLWQGNIGLSEFFFFCLFVFYEVILVSWPISWVWRFNQVDLSLFLYLYFIDLFFNFILQHWVDWELSFILYFNLLFMELSESHDLGHGFDMLTQVDLDYLFFFFNFILQYWVDWEWGFIIYFNMLYMGLSWYLTWVMNLTS
jgi:hypothetical protein